MQFKGLNKGLMADGILKDVRLEYVPPSLSSLLIHLILTRCRNILFAWILLRAEPLTTENKKKQDIFEQ